MEAIVDSKDFWPRPSARLRDDAPERARSDHRRGCGLLQRKGRESGLCYYHIMCLAVYIASDRPIPDIPWNKKSRSVYTDDSRDFGARIQFTLPNVCYIGSDQGCGCGFIKDGCVAEELEEVNANYQNLAKIIRDLQANGGSVEIFSGWEGTQKKAPEFNEEISVEELLKDDFELEEQAFYRILP